MRNINRREFIGGALAGTAALLAPHSTRAADARVEILVGEQLGTVAPEIYSHFIEHLGGLVYDGVWVGEGSKIPNVGGVRAALVEHMRKIKPAVVRWPGGCFADQYSWRDGTGPRSSRPRRTNFWVSDSTKDSDSPQVYETNHFGTNEFMRFRKLVGAEPYLAANLRSLPAKEFYEWVEYCNAPDIAANVNKRPAKLWGLQGSASLHDKQLILTVVNPHHKQARETEVTVRGASVSSCRSRVLTSADIHAHNTFANPRALEPTDGEVKTTVPTFVYRFAPASVTRLRLTLA